MKEQKEVGMRRKRSRKKKIGNKKKKNGQKHKDGLNQKKMKLETDEKETTRLFELHRLKHEEKNMKHEAAMARHIEKQTKEDLEQKEKERLMQQQRQKKDRLLAKEIEKDKNETTI